MKDLILFLIIIVVLAGCEEMNDKHDEWLAKGETVYIGKIDSVKAFPGRNRLLLKYWISDPRAKTITVYWGVNDSYSKVLEVPSHNPTDAMELTFDGAERLDEGNYTFHWIASDHLGNKSMLFESLASVYGDLYQEKLINRRVIEANVADNGNINITWAGASSEDEIGVEIFYTDKENNSVTEFYPNLKTSLTLERANYLKGVTYRTLYKPALTAIDTFYTNIISLGAAKRTNVSQGKPVRASDILDPSNATQQPANAVDGNYATNATRWVSTASGEHWLEIDLQAEYSINSFKTWNGSSGYNNPIAAFKFQAWVNGAWLDLVSVSGNSDAQYGADFTPVTTSKVRFYAYNQVRLYEIAVYSIIKY